MSEHYRSYSAVFPLIFRTHDAKKQVLLARRANTGYMDGCWDFAGSGHVDEGETATQAVVRECSEELGIRVDAGDVRFVHLSHRLGTRGGKTYYDIYFVVDRYAGEPRIAEREKCDGLEWFYTDALPEDMIGIRRQALKHYFNAELYSEV
ncbi:MAG: NUDIX domain-containing protein [Clostridiaceae bacterium]|nr:NUDIX domain-containing protein [Clostridiaceae bacterium]